jgi:hypothetical protein
MKTTRNIRIAPRPTASLVGPLARHPEVLLPEVAGDAILQEAGGHAIIGHGAYRKAVLQAVLGVREPLVYFITDAAAHPMPI